MIIAHDELSHETVEEALKHADKNSELVIIIVVSSLIICILFYARKLQQPKKKITDN
ncbi:MAG: hypothetical protein AAB459_00530 [Patescibacteria group bacterium]